MQLVAKHSEMPDELGMNREGRKQLEKLRLERPKTRRTRRRNKRGPRYYTCVRCKKPFATPIGRKNHLKHSP